jgi:arginase
MILSREIELLEITSELGAGTRGACMGVGALKVASYNKKSDFFKKYPSITVRDFNEFLLEPSTTDHAIRIEHILKEFIQISGSVCSSFERGKFPFLLSGDHSTAAATIAGIKKSHPTSRIGAVWVDAHADLHSPYTSPSGNVHGMPLAIASHTDNLSQKVNNISEETKKYWELLKGIGGEEPNINIEDVVFIGVRDTEAPEDFLIKENSIKTILVNEVSQNGVDKAIADTFERLSDCDLIYVSFDVDSMDPTEISMGTGTPVDNGFSLFQTRELLLKLVENEKVCCFEIVEINPCLDNKKNKMAETAFGLIEEIAIQIEKK